MVVELTVPLVGVNVTVEDPENDPDVVEISKSDGAVTTKFAVKRAPETVKLCSEEAEPEHAEKFVND